VLPHQLRDHAVRSALLSALLSAVLKSAALRTVKSAVLRKLKNAVVSAAVKVALSNYKLAIYLSDVHFVGHRIFFVQIARQTSSKI
jgi:hypothetical protein